MVNKEEERMSDQLFGELRKAILDLEAPEAKAVAQKGIDAGVDPLEMINKSIRAALDILGDRFSAGDLFLPELMLAAKAADAAVAVLEPELLKGGAKNERLGHFLIATVKDDIHDIGKNIVGLLMKSAGFEVIDLGVDKSSEEILEAAKTNAVQIIGLSALLTTTMPRVQEFMELVQESGDRDKFKIIVGGAPVTQEFSDKIGADGYASDAARAVDLCKKLLTK
jgi:5-methyltetrahydrofolate--homocysteine methyltransferase